MTLFIIFSLVNSEKTFAAEHKLENLHIQVFINDDGSARIVETRTANLIEGTENYLVIGNLGKSEIKDFVVKESGLTYQYVNKWNINASRQDKAFKNGIIKKKDGYELSWGIGKYGRHEYIVEYTVTNFIKQLQDSQILFWRFVNDKTNIPPEKVSVEIATKRQLNDSNQQIWAFGFTGNIGFEDGKVIAMSSEPLDENNYVTILVKFADGMFKSEDNIDQPFKVIQEKAFKGSDYGKESFSRSFPININMEFVFAVIFITLAILLGKRNPTRKLTKKKPRKFKTMYRNEYYRDFPYEGNFLDVYYLLYVMGASKFEDLLTSFILKWVKEEKILVENESVGILFKREEAVIHFFNKEMDHSTSEGKLFNMMLEAAGSNDALEQNEFTNWTGKNRKKLISWEKDFLNESLQTLQDLGYIHLQEKRRFLFKTRNYEVTEKGIQIERKIHKYVNYLRDYSLLNEHDAVNVKIWDEIMIWAAILGLTDEVRKQFKNLYPAYEQESSYSGSTLNNSSAFSRSTSSARISSGSSGGGGSSSSGGGGGSSGGGSGGGTR